MAETEQNKTEEPTPFKLKRARQKGTVARGADLGFFSALAGLTLYATIAGADAVTALARDARKVLASSIEGAGSGQPLPEILGASFTAALWPVVTFACTVTLVVLLFEIIQIRGIAFSGQPLKPDFGRLNPAKGLKKLFSARMLKETLKSILKLVLYVSAAAIVVIDVFSRSARAIFDAGTLTEATRDGVIRLLFAFLLLALIFAALDQVLARRDFLKQMRMSRSELTREVKDREGEPRIKRKRKELHAAFVKQSSALGQLPGSDILIVNPEHFAVALAYNASEMEAPALRTKGRNAFALLLKKRAAELSIPIFESPRLARALYRHCKPGDEIPSSEYRAVVDIYLKLASTRARRVGASDA